MPISISKLNFKFTLQLLAIKILSVGLILDALAIEKEDINYPSFAPASHSRMQHILCTDKKAERRQKYWDKSEKHFIHATPQNFLNPSLECTEDIAYSVKVYYVSFFSYLSSI